MAAPEELDRLIARLYLELEEVNQITNEGIDLIRPILSQFSENTLLVQFFAYLNNVHFLVQSYKQRIQYTIRLLSLPDTTLLESQEASQDLSTMLGIVLETKMRVVNIVDRLRDLS